MALHASEYYAVYLNLARIQNRPLATLDKSLIRAAESIGVEVFT
jgi:predicted nucleic acid-binding protein